MWEKDEFKISTDKSLLDFDVIHKFISCESYWGLGRSQEVMRKAIDNTALCFGVYHGKNQIGFARVISDLATFGYLADVFILKEYRGLGLGKWLIHTIVSHPELVGLRRMTLFSRTPEFYLDKGFSYYDSENVSKFMERRKS